MVFSYEQAGDLMDEIADSFPQEFYRALNGSVLLLPEVKQDPNAEDLYIMGTYCCNEPGRSIEIYYGSFAQLAKLEAWTKDDWRKELWDTLSHELTHHLESLAGEQSLEKKDAEFMEHYWSRNQLHQKKDGSLPSEDP